MSHAPHCSNRDLSPRDRLILLAIEHNPGQSKRRICGIVDMPPALVSRSITALRRQGYLPAEVLPSFGMEPRTIAIALRDLRKRKLIHTVSAAGVRG